MALALVGVALLYPILANLFLGTRLFRHFVNQKPETIFVEYEAASSFWPGRVHVKNLRVRGKDAQVEWLLAIDDGDFRVGLFDLAKKKFHASDVHGEGVSLFVRSRMKKEDATAERVALLPKIAGFEDVPLKGPDADGPPPSDEEAAQLWTVQLDGVVADPAREIWLDTLHWRGDARVAGAFFLRPTRWADVGPVHGELRAMELVRGEQTIVRALRGPVDVRVDGFDPRLVSGVDLWKQAHVTVRLDGEVPSLTFANDALRDDGVALAGGGGPLHVDLGIDATRVRDGSVMELDGSAATVTRGALSATLTPRAKIFARGDALELDAWGKDVVVARAKGGQELVRAGVIGVMAKSRGAADVREPLREAAIGFDVPRADLPDLRVVDELLPPGGPFVVDGGHGTLRAHADVAGASAHGEIALAVDGMNVRVQSHPIHGALALDAKLPGIDLLSGRVDFSGSRLELRDAGGPGGAEHWSGALDVAQGAFDARAKLARAALRLHGRDARPFVAWLLEGTPLPSWTSDLIGMHPLDATGELVVGNGRLELHGLRAQSGPVQASAEYVKRGPREDAAILVDTPIKSGGVDITDGHAKPILLDAPAWYAQKTRGAPTAAAARPAPTPR